MKKLLLIMLACVTFSVSAYAVETLQNVKESGELTKKQKKAIEKRNREMEDSIRHAEAVEAMKKGYYVLMADRMMLKNRAYVNPSPNTNFLLVQGEEAIIQIASNGGRPGLNGMGGITVDGRITGLKGGKMDKKGRVSYSFTVTGPAVSAQVQITLYKEDNQAMAIISPNFWSGNMTIYGKIEPYEEKDPSKAMKGVTIP